MADGSVHEDVVITKPFGQGKITCREIRRNSAGCLRFRNECEKCREIQHIGETDGFFSAREGGEERAGQLIVLVLLQTAQGRNLWRAP